MCYRQNLRAVKEGRVAIVDGNQMFARPGPRLVDALEFLAGLLHNSPALIPADFPWTWWDTQKATLLAETKSEPPSVHTKGTAGSTSADSSSQVANDNSSNSADGSMLVPNGSSSAAACKDIAGKGASLPDSHDSTSQSGRSNQAAEQSACNSQGCADKAGQQSAEQSGTATQNSGHVKSRQQAAGGSGSAPQDSGSSRAGRQAAERKWGAAPFLGLEIEEAHAAAIDAGLPTYTDPATGYKVALGCNATHNG